MKKDVRVLTLVAFIGSLTLLAPVFSLAAETHREQIEALRAMSVLEPANPEWHEALGHLLLGAEVEVSEENSREAEQHLRRAVETDPARYWAWYDLAILHMDTEEGNQYLKNAISASPKFPEPYYWLAYAHCRNWRDADATQMFEAYLQVAQGDLNETGRIETAKKLLAELRSGVEGEELRKVRRPMKGGIRDDTARTGNPHHERHRGV